MPKRRAHRFAQRARDPERPDRQVQSSAAGTPATLGDERDQLVQRRDLAARQDVGPIRGGRVLAAQPKPFHEIVDVGQMVVDLAAARA